MTGRQGRRHRKLLDDLKERRGYSHLKEEALDRTMWRPRFGRGFGPVVRQNTKSNSNFCKPLKNNSEGCPSNQVSAAAMTSASDEEWRPFDCFSVGSG